MLEDEIVIMNVERYIEVYSNETDELLYSYKITIPDHLVIDRKSTRLNSSHRT